MAGKLDRKIAAVDKLRRLTGKDPDHEPAYAAALVELADDLKEAGRDQEALARVREARLLYQDRVREWRPDELRAATAMSREAQWLAEAGDPGAEDLFAGEAGIYLEQARNAPPDAVLEGLAELEVVLHANLTAKRFRSAEGAARACAELARRLVGQEPDAETHLVNIHNSLALSLAGQGRFDEAHRVASRSFEIAEQAGVWGRPVDSDPRDLAYALMMQTLAPESWRVPGH
jgi:tetratricopeptide (TPR) repeat protein